MGNVGIGAFAYSCAVEDGASLSARLDKPRDLIRDASHRLLKPIIRRSTKTPVFPLDPAQELLQLLYFLTNRRKLENAPEAATKLLQWIAETAYRPMPERCLPRAGKAQALALPITCDGAALRTAQHEAHCLRFEVQPR